MYQPLPLFLGLRYTRAKRRDQFVSFISLISILGIAIGVWALITIISVMNGFESELRNRILGMASHATIAPYGGHLDDWQSVLQQSQQNPHVQGAAPYVEGQLMLSHRGRVSGALLRGIEPEMESHVADIEAKMKIGSLNSLQAGKWNIVLGNELLRALGLQVGDRVTVITPEANITAAGFIPRLKTFTISGMFELGMHEYDSALVLMHHSDSAKLLRMPAGSVSGVRLKLDDIYNARPIAEALSQELGGAYKVRDWTFRHSNLFRAIKTEQRVMAIILLLIIGVAAFNIISTLIMVVTDKRADIAILRTLGATPATIMLIFIVQGTMVGVIGTIIGMITGSLSGAYIGEIIAFFEDLFHFKVLAADVYYISDLPSELRLSNVLIAGAFSFAISMLVTLYPAWRAAKINPAEALRYE